MRRANNRFGLSLEPVPACRYDAGTGVVLVDGVRFFWVLIGLCGVLQAAEVDQFTPALPLVLDDSQHLLDAEVNRRLMLALDIANRAVLKPPHLRGAPRYDVPRCDEQRLYEALEWQLARPLIGQLEEFAEQSSDVSRRPVPLAQSVYRSFFWVHSPSLVLSERMASVIRLDRTELGTDKLGHFFTEGYSYFRLSRQLQEGLEPALLFGEWSESVYFGAQTTGVYSYADLTANFHGLRFWNRILARQTDPLENVVPVPYVECRDYRWQLIRMFHWAHYVDDAWNESINCSLFRTPGLLQQVQEQTPECRSNRLPLARYHQWQERLLNPVGLAVMPDHLQPEVILERRASAADIRLSPAVLEYLRQLREQLENWREQEEQQARLNEAGSSL